MGNSWSTGGERTNKQEDKMMSSGESKVLQYRQGEGEKKAENNG
jgi:hypothetical protein